MDNTDNTLSPIDMDQHSGKLQIQIVCEAGHRPIDAAVVKIYNSTNPDTLLDRLTTNISGITETIDLDTPPLEYSMQPPGPKPYSEYLVEASAPGLQTVTVEGVQIFPNTSSLQMIFLPRITENSENSRRIVIGPHYLYGGYPIKVYESEVKEMPESDDPFVIAIPEYLIVHDGIPDDATAIDYYVEYRDYIKNVVSSVAYANWTDATLYATILATLSFTLNRYFTNWYQRQGYSFHITASPAYDLLWLYGRNIFDNISLAVDYMFNLFLARPGILQPILTQLCRGAILDCPQMMSLWGAKALGDTGYDMMYILHFYYGSDLYISYTNVITGLVFPWQGTELKLGSQGGNVGALQKMLELIGRVYIAIPLLGEGGTFNSQTEKAVSTYQEIFHLPVTGIVDAATWYSITSLYNSLIDEERHCK
ncbi:peptidoglycan-binding domain-containing protein [Anaerocolumna xylanovorans]|uniref:Putative peptidoglycan binding domain-containing protein n=1 Tax=Anaerocolumna xylanovorans DSM 12503 TaxID=1121345 RepID=A0A1M7Y4M3_9FIRM|nr:peptidoglycan-binding domain-containing protein [Anaerocolumna xylanovorans]SHO47081.1 Putative peptidoglycan binding domain-containing protein [Anaerocolumna xylanovorans DSM 12503]